MLTLANPFFIPQPQRGRNTKAEQWARPLVQCATLGKGSPAPGKKRYVIHPTWCCVVLHCHGDGEDDEENKSEVAATVTFKLKK